MFYKILLITLVLAPCVLGQETQTGLCGTLTGIPNFVVNSYMGTWHQIARVENTYELGACSSAIYTLVSGSVLVNNTEVINGTLSYNEGTATPATDSTGTLTVVFPSVTGGTQAGTTANYYILATDYTNYALVMSCVDLTATTRSVSGWKLSRAATGFSAETSASIDTAVANSILSPVTWSVTAHTEAACTLTSSASTLTGAATWTFLIFAFVVFYK